MKKMTKILSTISSRVDEQMVKDLINAGVNGFRFNTAHQSFEESKSLLDLVRRVSTSIPIIIDTKGPEIRTTIIKNDTGKLEFKKGDKVKIKGAPNEDTTKEIICLNYKNYTDYVTVSTLILIDDGDIAFEVVSKEGDILNCITKNNGVVGSRKSVNTPGIRVELPSISEKDHGFIKFAIEHKVDFIAHSFVRDKHDVFAIREILDQNNSNIGIISKMENQEGVDNIDEIIDFSDGIMIARGDLGIEVPFEKIPFIQKEMIRKCREKNKFVITATQMLHTMIEKPRPTRAEASDVANAVYDGTDCLMLSGETASGKYPLEAVKTMAKIAYETEKHLPNFSLTEQKIEGNDIEMFTKYLTENAVNSTNHLPIKSFVIDTETGRTAKDLSSLRPLKDIFVLCYSKHLIRRLALVFGITPFYIDNLNYDPSLKTFLGKLTEKNELNKQDLVVILTRDKENDKGTTTLKINYVKNLLR